MSMLKKELIRNSALLASYMESLNGVGVVLIDPILNIIDCNTAFVRMFNIQNNPIGLQLSDFLQFSIDDLKRSGEIKLQYKNRKSAKGILDLYSMEVEVGYLIFCERLILTESLVLENFMNINNELISLQRELVKKNVQLEKLKGQLDERIKELEAALARVKILEGIIPICMYCKKIRDDKNSWQQLESYITEHSDALFSHGICPHCSEEQMNIIRNLKPK